MMPSYPLEFLWWFKLVGFFGHDARREMVELGIADNTALCLILNDAFREANVLQWWHSFCRTDRHVGTPDPELTSAANLYFEHYKKKWDEIKEKQLTI